MSKAPVQLDPEGRLDLAGLKAPFGPGDMVEFYVAGDHLVIKECPAHSETADGDRLRDPRNAAVPNAPRR